MRLYFFRDIIGVHILTQTYTMPTDPNKVIFVGALSSAAAWLFVQVIKLFRGEAKSMHADAAHNDILKGMRAELERLHEQLDAKENTIQRLVVEKAEQMEKLAQIPVLGDRIQDLELQVKSLLSLFNHFIETGALSLQPEHHGEILKFVGKNFSTGE